MLVKQFWLSRSLSLSIKLYVLLSLTLFTLEIFSNFCEAIRWIEPYYIALFASVSSVFCVLLAFLTVPWLITLCFLNISSLADNSWEKRSCTTNYDIVQFWQTKFWHMFETCLKHCLPGAQLLNWSIALTLAAIDAPWWGNTISTKR